MRPLHALAIAILCVGTAFAQSTRDTAAASGAARELTTATAQASPLSETARAAGVVEATRQPRPEEAQKKSPWLSPWMWVILAIGGTLVCVIPYLVVVHLVFKTGISVKRHGFF